MSHILRHLNWMVKLTCSILSVKIISMLMAAKGGVYLMYFVFLCNLLIPVVVIVTGRIMWKHYPKNINGLVGYRTSRSMKNMDTWKFANEYCGRLWYKMGLFMLALSVFVSVVLLGTNDSTYSIISLIFVLVQCVVLIVSIFPVEIALKKMFKEDGTRK